MTSIEDNSVEIYIVNSDLEFGTIRDIRWDFECSGYVFCNRKPGKFYLDDGPIQVLNKCVYKLLVDTFGSIDCVYSVTDTYSDVILLTCPGDVEASKVFSEFEHYNMELLKRFLVYPSVWIALMHNRICLYFHPFDVKKCLN